MTINFSKHPDRLVPAIVQDASTKRVLMLGYMNQEAVNTTQEKQQVTFYSRSKKRLWTKGEESGHFLQLVDMAVDCDQDTLLIQANPVGPSCHKGDDTCWGEDNRSSYGFLTVLEEVIADRKNNPSEKSYVARLFAKGINKIAQKVGEEAVETVIEAKDENSDLFLNESADLIFHLMILLQAKGHRLDDVVQILEERQNG
ncbi:MAG: bifunctional phosphoribosyl-AMP cyclohydrolase/phosphoribosyl-ATP diphosphatase HisIE [Bacteroidota bacterium]|nr:bifunctional phosphoribosyl-AMP cyclohydrolase/phosphoribosyl-ATP diphosphatase HisIE [Bacteroidota bacterium]MEC8239016.1 bifunctional phosphoribosyl-AMP cyclohydrolase/phosphoribosyl-ATP diphosphatase HisIE [Bacteroidota bacterium]